MRLWLGGGGAAPPIRQAPRCIPMHQMNIVEKAIEEMKAAVYMPSSDSTDLLWG